MKLTDIKLKKELFEAEELNEEWLDNFSQELNVNIAYSVSQQNLRFIFNINGYLRNDNENQNVYTSEFVYITKYILEKEEETIEKNQNVKEKAKHLYSNYVKLRLQELLKQSGLLGIDIVDFE